MLQHFRPEFYNRLDRVVSFSPLDEEAILEITHKELRQIAEREGVRRANLRLHWTDRFARFIAKAGIDHRYGARPLQRTIEQRVTSKVAQYLVKNPGIANQTLMLDLDSKGNVVVVE